MQLIVFCEEHESVFVEEVSFSFRYDVNHGSFSVTVAIEAVTSRQVALDCVTLRKFKVTVKQTRQLTKHLKMQTQAAPTITFVKLVSACLQCGVTGPGGCGDDHIAEPACLSHSLLL